MLTGRGAEPLSSLSLENLHTMGYIVREKEMRATLVSWDHATNSIALGTGEGTTLIPFFPDNPEKNAESFAALARYLQHLAPIMPPTKVLPWDAHKLPSPSQSEIERAQRFQTAAHARGNGLSAKPRKPSNEEFLDALLKERDKLDAAPSTEHRENNQ